VTAARLLTARRRGNIRSMELVINGQAQRLDPAPATVADLVRALKLEGKRIAIECNGEIVPKSRYAQTKVTAGDHLEVVAAVGGG
jgi:sulfur carrier protein